MENKKYNRKANIRENAVTTKYKIVNELAYTLDGILIYNLKGYANVDDFLKEITKYIQSLVKNVKVSSLNNYNYLLEFGDPKDAAKVLQIPQHLIFFHILHVTPCSSWFQPHYKNFMKYVEQKHNPKVMNGMHSFEEEDDNDDKNINKSNEQIVCLITKLNDDCLMEICKKLTIRDQVNFALCCQRFCDIFQMISFVEYSNLNMKTLRTLNCFQIKIFALTVGPCVKDLKFHNIKFAKDFCTSCINVETFKMDFTEVEFKEFLPFLCKQMPNIKQLELSDIQRNDILACLKLLKNLKTLDINSSDITGEFITSLEHLTALSLYHCYLINENYVKDICKNLKNLQYLDIRNSSSLTSNDFEQILESLKQLETFKFTNNTENFNCITRLQHLKVLVINALEYKDLSHDFLQKLVIYQGDQLLELKFDNIKIDLQQFSFIVKLKNLKAFYCSHNDMLNDKCLYKLLTLTKLQDINFDYCNGITNAGILKLLEYCLELKKLNLVGCEHLTSHIIGDAFKLLQEQHVKYLRTNRVHIIVEDVYIFPIVVTELGLQIPNRIVKITFEKNLHHNYLRFYRNRNIRSETFICRSPPISSRNKYF